MGALDMLSYARNQAAGPVWLGFEGTISAYDATTGSATLVEGEGYSNFGDDPDQSPFPISGPLLTPQVGDGHGPVGGERAVAIPTRNGWRILLYTDEDDAPGVPVGERWIRHRNPQTLAWDTGLKFTNDGPTANDGLGGAYFGNSGALTQSQTAGGFMDVLNDTAKTATRLTPGGISDELDDTTKQALRQVSSSIFELMDAVAKQITHQAGSGTYSQIDGVLGAIQHVASQIGIGDKFENLTTNDAAFAKTHITSFSSSIVSDMMQSFANIFSTAMSAAGIPNAAALEAIVQAANWVVNNVTHPTIPSGSSITRIKS